MNAKMLARGRAFSRYLQYVYGAIHIRLCKRNASGHFLLVLMFASA